MLNTGIEAICSACEEYVLLSRIWSLLDGISQTDRPQNQTPSSNLQYLRPQIRSATFLQILATISDRKIFVAHIL